MSEPVDFQKLKEQAESLRGWFNTTDAWLDTSEDSACAVVGHISDEGACYPVAVVDCDQYDAPSDSMKLAKFYASANPKAILVLIAAYEALQKENEALIQKLETAAFNHFSAQESIEALRKELDEFEAERNRRDEMRKALEAQMNGDSK